MVAPEGGTAPSSSPESGTALLATPHMAQGPMAAQLLYPLPKIRPRDGRTANYILWSTAIGHMAREFGPRRLVRYPVFGSSPTVQRPKFSSPAARLGHTLHSDLGPVEK